MRKNFVNLKRLRHDIQSLTSGYKLSGDELQWFTKIYRIAVFSRKLYKVEGPGKNHAGHNVMLVSYEPDKALRDDARKVLEWFSALPEYKKYRYSSSNAVTLKRALEEVEHREQQDLFNERVAAARASNRYIEPDTDNAPEVLHFGDGWKVVWLKTDDARKTEREVMVLGVGTRPVPEGEVQTFSLRHDDCAYSSFTVTKDGGYAAVAHACEHTNTAPMEPFQT